jgi:LPS sulfotransferase NodH
MGTSDAPGQCRFVAIAHARSGSTLLLNALREHPALRVYGELFQEEEEHRGHGCWEAGEIYVDGTDGPAHLEDRIFRRRDDPELVAIGFKLLYNQAREPATRGVWRYLIDQPELRVIHLTRERPLEAFVSMCEAGSSGHWAVGIDEEPPPPIQPIRIDPEECLAFLDSLYAHRAWVRHAFRRHEVLELSYERLVDDFDATLREVQVFLQVPPQPLPALLRRQGTRPLPERVTNFAAITALLERTIHGRAQLASQ